MASSSASSALTYRGLDADVVGTVYNAKPDGQADGHFTLVLDTGGVPKVVTAIELNSTTGGVWDTIPQGSWAVLGVIRGGTRLNPADENLKDAVSGRVTYELYAGDYGYFQAAHTFVAKVTFSDATTVTTANEAAGPGEESTGTPTAPKPTTTVKPRLDGTFAVKQTVVSVKNIFDRKAGDVLDRSMTFRAHCVHGPCAVTLTRTTSSGDTVKVPLSYNGIAWIGTETFVGPYTCNGELFLHGETGQIQWQVGITKSKMILGQLRATEIRGKGFSRFVPTADVRAKGCKKTTMLETDTLVGTRR